MEPEPFGSLYEADMTGSEGDAQDCTSRACDFVAELEAVRALARSKWLKQRAPAGEPTACTDQHVNLMEPTEPIVPTVEPLVDPLAPTAEPIEPAVEPIAPTELIPEPLLAPEPTPAGPSLEIFVQPVNAPKLQLLIDVSETLGAIRQRVSEALDSPVDTLRLFFLGHELSDPSLSTAALRLENGSVLQLAPLRNRAVVAEDDVRVADPAYEEVLLPEDSFHGPQNPSLMVDLSAINSSTESQPRLWSSASPTPLEGWHHMYGQTRLSENPIGRGMLRDQAPSIGQQVEHTLGRDVQAVFNAAINELEMPMQGHPRTIAANAANLHRGFEAGIQEMLNAAFNELLHDELSTPSSVVSSNTATPLVGDVHVQLMLNAAFHELAADAELLTNAVIPVV